MSHHRNIYLDNLKAVLTILVVLGHFIEVCLKGSNISKSLFLFIYSFHMPLFLFCAGLTCKDIINQKDKTISRTIFFFCLYVAYKGIIFLIKAIFTDKVTFSLLSESGVPWYLFTVATYYWIAYLLGNLHKWKAIAGLSLFTAIVCGYDTSIGDFLILSRSIVFFPFFATGLWIEDINKIQRYLDKIWIKLLSTYFVLMVLLLCIAYIDEIYFMRPIFTGRNSYKVLGELFIIGPIYRIGAYIVSITLSIAVMALVPRQKICVGEASLDKAGQRTLQIYFWHRPILYIFSYCGIFKVLENNLGWRWGRICWLIFGLCLTFVLALKVWGKPFEWLHKLLEP